MTCWNITFSKKTSFHCTFKNDVASDSKISSCKISLFRNKGRALRISSFQSYYSSFVLQDKYEYCTVQWMIKNNHITEIGDILNARAQSMLLIVMNSVLLLSKHQHVVPMDTLTIHCMVLCICWYKLIVSSSRIVF